MDDHFDIGRVFVIGKFDITRLTCITNIIYTDQTDRIGSVGYVSTLIELILSTEWQRLKNKTDMYNAITILKCVMLLTLTCRNLSTDM